MLNGHYETEKDMYSKLGIIFDILIKRTSTGYSTTVYMKAASSISNRYIHFTSSKAWKEKASAIRTLKARAYDYCSDPTLLADIIGELAFLLEVFMQNGYPHNTVWRILSQETREKTDNN